MMVLETLDCALVELYADFGIPADRFIGDSELTREFVELVYERLGVLQADAPEIMRRLLTLRKTGRLPRLQRAYHGRNCPMA